MEFQSLTQVTEGDEDQTQQLLIASSDGLSAKRLPMTTRTGLWFWAFDPHTPTTLIDSNSLPSLDLDARTLKDDTGTYILNVRQMINADGLPLIDWSGSLSILHTNGIVVLDADAGRLFDPTASVSVDWNQRILRDPAGFLSVIWDSRILTDASEQTALNWADASNVTIGLSNSNAQLNMPSGVIRVPNMGSTDPMDGNNTLYFDAVTRVVKVGT